MSNLTTDSDNAFATASYYSCDEDSESLSCETPEEAIEMEIDRLGDPKTPIERVIAECCPLTVYAYARRQVTPTWMHGVADGLRASFEEQFSEEFGDADGDHRIPEQQLATLASDFEAAIARLVADTEVWQCETVAKRDYSAAEVEAILRESAPEWFEETLP